MSARSDVSKRRSANCGEVKPTSEQGLPLPGRTRPSALGGEAEVTIEVRRKSGEVTRVYENKLLSSSRGFGHETEAVHLGSCADLLGESAHELEAKAVPELVGLRVQPKDSKQGVEGTRAGERMERLSTILQVYQEL